MAYHTKEGTQTQIRTKWIIKWITLWQLSDGTSFKAFSDKTQPHVLIKVNLWIIILISRAEQISVSISYQMKNSISG